MKVTITQQHIDQGKPGRASECALASAIQEATGQPHWVGYSRHWEDKADKKRMSREAMDFVRWFDGAQGLKAGPREIEIDLQ